MQTFAAHRVGTEMAQLLKSVDASSIAFTAAQKHGPIYVMRPVKPVLLQTPAVTCVASLGPDDRKLHVQLDSATEAWIRGFEESFKAYAKANTHALFNKELDPEFIDESFRSCLPPPGAKAPVAFTLLEDAAVFLHTHELLTREAVAAGVAVNMLLEVACIQFGKKWFTPKLRVLSLRIPPPAPPPCPTPTYESLGWIDEVAGAAADDEADDEADEDDDASIDIDLDELAPPPPRQRAAAAVVESLGPLPITSELSMSIEDVTAAGAKVCGLDVKQLLLIAAALAVALWFYKKYYASTTKKEGFANETRAEQQQQQQQQAGTGCAKSVLGNFLTCDKHANDFGGRQKSAVERFQEQLAEERQKAEPLVPDVQLPPMQDYVLPTSTTKGKWDRIADVRGGIDVAYAGSLTSVSPAAIDAAMSAAKLNSSMTSPCLCYQFYVNGASYTLEFDATKSVSCIKYRSAKSGACRTLSTHATSQGLYVKKLPLPAHAALPDVAVKNLVAFACRDALEGGERLSEAWLMRKADPHVSVECIDGNAAWVSPENLRVVALEAQDALHPALPPICFARVEATICGAEAATGSHTCATHKQHEAMAHRAQGIAQLCIHRSWLFKKKRLGPASGAPALERLLKEADAKLEATLGGVSKSSYKWALDPVFALYEPRIWYRVEGHYPHRGYCLAHAGSRFCMLPVWEHDGVKRLVCMHHVIANAAFGSHSLLEEAVRHHLTNYAFFLKGEKQIEWANSKKDNKFADSAKFNELMGVPF
ncbi:hypothetical protein COO60DRAFT_1465400 [Scenedesmus sp. NREL 46B-D3]|nr:hypothetical protein COO60DRAFT_1465400 [Scenedesmus sp. NREL 46B-D3]